MKETEEYGKETIAMRRKMGKLGVGKRWEASGGEGSNEIVEMQNQWEGEIRCEKGRGRKL